MPPALQKGVRRDARQQHGAIGWAGAVARMREGRLERRRAALEVAQGHGVWSLSQRSSVPDGAVLGSWSATASRFLGCRCNKGLRAKPGQQAKTRLLGGAIDQGATGIACDMPAAVNAAVQAPACCGRRAAIYEQLLRHQVRVAMQTTWGQIPRLDLAAFSRSARTAHAQHQLLRCVSWEHP